MRTDQRPRPPGRRRSRLSWSWADLLLLFPLAALITPLYNRAEPSLLGFPLFYWAQFLFIPLGVICVVAVYLKTGDRK
ncbi:MAG TPA: DUF3311 domain-containing protein [Pseudonocardiaceae bacterium]|nr:DUF3311 domain-containing protein [Pseudonocardiaceae bacterium]